MGRRNTLAIGVGGGEYKDREGEGRGQGEWDSGDSVDVCRQGWGAMRVCSPLVLSCHLSPLLSKFSSISV